MDERERRLEVARGRVETFIRENPGYTMEGVEQPGQGVNNLVVFARKGERQVVFKAFIWDESKDRECFALNHWRKTGLVPELLEDVDSEMLIMSWLKGGYLGQGEGAEAWRTTGHAAGSLTQVPLTGEQKADFESRFYGKETLEDYFGKILSLGRSVQARDPDFRDGFWKENLDFMERELGAILAQPRVLCHEDVANVYVHQGRFAGFFDLEMSRVGCAAMQLGAALNDLVCRHDGDWGSFQRGWEEAVGRQLSPADKRAAIAASHFLNWCVITRYLSYDGTPGTGYEWASPAEPAKCRREIERIQKMVGI